MRRALVVVVVHIGLRGVDAGDGERVALVARVLDRRPGFDVEDVRLPVLFCRFGFRLEVEREREKLDGGF